MIEKKAYVLTFVNKVQCIVPTKYMHHRQNQKNTNRLFAGKQASPFFPFAIFKMSNNPLHPYHVCIKSISPLYKTKKRLC